MVRHIPEFCFSNFHVNCFVVFQPRTEERQARAAVKATKKKNSQPESEDENEEFNTGKTCEDAAAVDWECLIVLLQTRLN